MRQEKIYVLNSIEDVKKFAQGIYDEYYYVDSDGECWKGDELKEAICNSSYDYDVWLGQMKEVVPYEFYYFEESEIEYKKNHVLYFDSDAPVFCESEQEVISCCFGEFESLHSYDKQKSIITAYKCFGVPDYLECQNDAEIVGFALRYNRKNYFCSKSESPNIIFSIDSDLKRLDSSNLVEEDGSVFYRSSIGDLIYKVCIDEQFFKREGEIDLDENINISK